MDMLRGQGDTHRLRFIGLGIPLSIEGTHKAEKEKVL